MPAQDMLVHAYRSFIEPVDLANYELIMCDGTLLQKESQIIEWSLNSTNDLQVRF